MNTIGLSLTTRYDVKPSYIKIICCGDVIYDGTMTEDLDLTHQISHFDQFEMVIYKSGKTKDQVDGDHSQEVTINGITLNGVDLKTGEFGEFMVKGNPYVDDHVLQTNRLYLNGDWILKLPIRNLVGGICAGSREKMKDGFRDCDIACFGCSQTYGALLDYSQSWPQQVRSLTDKSVMNYGVPGSNINEITALVEDYLRDNDAKTLLIYLPHTFRRQTTRNGELTNIQTTDEENKDLIMHGEEHSVASISGDLLDWLDKISKETTVFFGTYHHDEFELFQKTPLKKYMFPFLEGDKYPKASDNLHHGAEFNRDFAKMLVDFLDLG